MGLYEGIKDVAKVIQQADNVELYKKLIELSSQALEMQSEITRLSSENAELKKEREVENRIERHQEPYITLKEDVEQILYCSHCWDYERKLVQVKCYDCGSFKCIHCENNGIYDKDKNDAYERERHIRLSLRGASSKNRW